MAKKQLNKKMVVALTLCTFAVMIVLSVVMLNRLQQRDPKYFVELAESAAEQEQWQQAALFYEQAWQRSDDPKYLVEVGEMLLHEGDVQNARIAWRKALVQDPGLIEGHVRQLTMLMSLARLYDAPQDWEEVRDSADAMLKTSVEKSDAQSAFARNARGFALIHLRDRGADPDEGLSDLQASCDLAPESVDYAIDLAGEYVRREQPDRAELIYSNLVASFASPGPKASKVQVAFAQFLFRTNRAKEAEPLFEKAIALAENDKTALHEARLAYAGYLTQKWALAMREPSTKEEAASFIERAESILKQCIDSDPDAFDAFLQLAAMYRSAQRYAEVLEVCEKRISQGIRRKGVDAGQNRVSAFTLMIYASEAAVALGINAAKDGNVAERDQWYARAEQYVADARGEAPTHPRVLSQAGRVKIARGQERAGLEDLRAADEAYRSFGAVNWENRMLRARVHLQLNEAGAARQVLEEVMDDARTSRGADSAFWSLYAQTLVRSGDLSRALSIVERVLTAIPDNDDALRIKAAILERQGRTTEAGQIEQRLSGSGTVSAILEARSASLEGDSQRAVSILRKALETDSSDVRLVSVVVQELSRLNRGDEAREIAEKALRENPEDVSLQRLVIATRSELTPEQRDQAMLKLIESEQDAYQRALQLTAYYSRRNDPASTIKAIDEAERHLRAADTPMAQRATAVQHAALLRTKLRAAAQLNDQASMASARDEGRAANVDGCEGKSILGLYHLLRREYELAERAFQDALQKQPTQVSSMILLGQCLKAQGRTDEARLEFERASKVNPDEALAHQGLALLAQIKKDTETFQRELAICERLMPEDPWVREQVLIREEEADPAGAIQRREQQRTDRPEDFRNLERLASLYEKVGDQKKAEEAHSSLMALLPNDIRIAALAADFQRRNEHPAKALEIVKQFAESRPTAEEKANAAILVANEYFQQHDLAGVERTLLAASEISTTLQLAQTIADFYLRQLDKADKALPWFDKSVDLASSSQSPHLADILERRVGCLLDRGVNNFERAREDVAELRRRFPDSARAILLESEMHARAGEINEAVASLSEYLTKRPNDAYALFQRARHEVARGRSAAAIDDLQRIKRNDPLVYTGEPRILLASLYAHEGRGDLRIAELESLAKDSPDSSRALQALVEAYLQEGRFADADRIVTTQINRSGEKADSRWFFLRGSISLRLNDADKALSDFRKGAEVAVFTPAALSSVLGAYLQLGRFAEGVAYLEGLESRREDSSLVQAQYAQLLARSGSTEKAVEVFRRAMALAMTDESSGDGADSTHADEVASVTENLRSAFQTDEGLALFDKTPVAPPLARANERILVRLLGLAKQTDAAVARIDRLIDSATSDRERAALLHEKGDIQQVGGQMEPALASYEEALKYDAENWVTLNNVAYILSDKRGANQLALPYARRAASKADNPYTLDTLGWIYVGLGDFALATAELNRAIRLNPEYSLSYYHLGESYRRNGQFDEATAILESGRRIAESGGDAGLLALIDASMEQARNRQSNP